MLSKLTKGQIAFAVAVVLTPLASCTIFLLNTWETPSSVAVLLVLWLLSSLATGTFFYWMREHDRTKYGIVEVILALLVLFVGTVLSAANKVPSPNDAQLAMKAIVEGFNGIFLVFAGVYAMMSGLDNIGEGMRQNPSYSRAWDWYALRTPNNPS